MAKKKAVQELLAEFYNAGEECEYNLDEAVNTLKTLGSEAKVDMITAGAVLMMARLAERHGVHILDCMLAVPKWTALIVGSQIWKDIKVREADE